MKKRRIRKTQKIEQAEGRDFVSKARIAWSVIVVVVPIIISIVATWVAFDSKNASNESAAKTLALQERLGRIETPLDYSISVKQIPQVQGTMKRGEEMAFTIDNNFAYTIALSQNEGQLYSLTKIDVLGDEAVDRIDENNVERLKYDISDHGVDWDREVFEATYHEDASGASIPLLAESKEWNITFSILILRDTIGDEYWGLLAIPLTAKAGGADSQDLIDGSMAVYTEASIEKIDEDGKELNAVLLSGLEMQSDPQIVAEKILDSNYQSDDQISWAREQRAYADAPSEKGHLFREIEDENLKERIVDEVSQIQVVFNHVRELYRDM